MKCAACGYMDKESIEKELNTGGFVIPDNGKYARYINALKEAEEYGEFRKARVKIEKPYLGKYINDTITIHCCPRCGTVKMEV